MTLISVSLPGVLNALGFASLKATAILGGASLLTRLLRRRTAALRHLVWTTALGSCVAVLILPTVLPAWRVIPIAAETRRPAPVEVAAASPSRSEVNGPAARRSPTRAAAHATTAPAIQYSVTTSRRGSLPALALALWLAGVVAVTLRFTRSRIALQRLARSSNPHSEWAVLVARISRRMGIERPVSLRTTDDVELPFTWGVFRPQIVLPGDASEWTAERRLHVLEHELAHIKRLDAGTQLIAQAAFAVFWFHPLVWYAVLQARCERERACDDHVLESGAVAADYASDLLALVTNYKYVERHSAALAFARRSHFEGRLLALLDRNVDRRVLSPFPVALVLSLSVTLVVPLAALQGAAPRIVPRPAGVATPSTVAVSDPVSPPRRSAAPTVTVERPAIRHPAQPDVSDVFAPCPLRMPHHDSDASSDGAGNATWTANGNNDLCSFSVRAEGHVVFNHDASAIERIAPGGYLELAANIRGDVTQLVVRSSAAGELGYQVTRNGQPVDFSAGGGAWLQQFLIGLDRTTAFAVDTRFPVLLQAGGPDGVLAEVGRMHSDHAALVYLRRLIENATLDAGAVRRTGDAIASMGAGHETAELIIAVASKYSLGDAETRAVFLRSALAVRTDHERARTFLSIVTAATLDRSETAAVLGSLITMRDDLQKGRVLLAIAATQRLDGALRDAFLRVADTIGDARTRGRALDALSVHSTSGTVVRDDSLTAVSAR